ncbi:MAG: signal peptide peptidase SppA [Porphyromonadaceae bacterium]|nr:signal peptide peptidase SppA [Porphyromonadaceae bacterium]
MKQFLKFTLATIVGIIITSFLGMIIFFGIIGSIAASSSKTVKTSPNSVYELELSGQLVERSKDDPFSGIFASSLGQSAIKSIGLDDVLSNIKKAKDDKNILGIYLNGGSLSGGFASFKEIRNALEDFKTSGKFIVAYADTYSQKNYYLSSVADKIYLNPLGMVELQGLAANLTFFKNTLDKLGVEMQVVKVGTYKSAVEPYIQTSMSEANKEQVTTFITSIWNNMVNDISDSRNISKEELNQIADKMMTFQPTELNIEKKLVDSLTYADGMKDVLMKLTNVKDKKDVKLLSHGKMNKVSTSEKLKKDRVAVIYGVGGIDMGERDGITSKDLVETINKVKDEKSVKAVVFRINSGGGSGYGSEQIWHALTELKKEKPLIVSMGDYAASGGYYIACLADSILAQPNTLTGSIGVFGTIPNIAGLNKKIGLTHDGVKTNKLSDAISFNRPFSPEERNLMQGYVDRFYEFFIKRCADGRSMHADSIKAIAEGRVWTGEDAKRLGLVDELGGLSDAIKIAANKANLEDYSIKSYPEKEDFMTTLLKDFGGETEARIMKSTIGNENYQLLKQIEQAKKMNGIYALMPMSFSF